MKATISYSLVILIGAFAGVGIITAIRWGILIYHLQHYGLPI